MSGSELDLHGTLILQRLFPALLRAGWASVAEFDPRTNHYRLLLTPAGSDAFRQINVLNEALRHKSGELHADDWIALRVLAAKHATTVQPPL